MSRPPEDSSARGTQVASPQTAPGWPNALERQAWDALRQVLDPELGVNIVDLGLVYDVTVKGDKVRVRVTMTTPACPLHTYVVEAVEFVLRRDLPAAREVDVQLVWEPPWHPGMLSPEARRQLGWEE